MHICVVMPSGQVYPIQKDYQGSLHPENVLSILKGVPLQALTSSLVTPIDAAQWGLRPIRVMVEVQPDEAPTPTRCPAVPPIKNDGWGHSLQDSCVEDTLRELLASEEGTDKHEELMKKYLGEDGEKVLLSMLTRDLYTYMTSSKARIDHLTEALQELSSRFDNQVHRLSAALAGPEVPPDPTAVEEDFQ